MSNVQRGGTVALAAGVAFLALSAGVYWVQPTLGRPLLQASSLVFLVVFLILAIMVSIRDRVSRGAALIGFAVTVSIGTLALYANHNGLKVGTGEQIVILALCPPFLAALALDNVGTLGTSFAILCISMANSVIYALAGGLLHWLWRLARRGTSGGDQGSI